MKILVRYGRLTSLARAMACQRCEGTTKDRATDFTEPCPLCTNTPGVNFHGWAYALPDGMTVEPGDLVEVPPTPYTGGQPCSATVLAVNPPGIDPRHGRREVLRILERGAVT